MENLAKVTVGTELTVRKKEYIELAVGGKFIVKSIWEDEDIAMCEVEEVNGAYEMHVFEDENNPMGEVIFDAEITQSFELVMEEMSSVEADDVRRENPTINNKRDYLTSTQERFGYVVNEEKREKAKTVEFTPDVADLLFVFNDVLEIGAKAEMRDGKNVIQMGRKKFDVTFGANFIRISRGDKKIQLAYNSKQNKAQKLVRRINELKSA